MRMGMRIPKFPTPDREKPRSLRLRLVLWYGTLLAVALGLFAVLLLVLTMDAISQSVDGDVQAEARIAALNVHNSLSAMPPYWPPVLSLDVIDTYGDPGIVVEVLDAQGHIHYYSANGRDAHVPISASTTRAALAGQITWYTATAGGERVRVEALPVRASIIGASSNAGEARGEQRDIIGMLVVAKSMDDVDDAFSLLRTLLLIAGLVILVGALAGGWVIATRVLHPLAEIVVTARTIAANARGTRIGGLSQRVRLVEDLLLLARADASTEMPIAVKEKADRASIGSKWKESQLELDHTVLQLVRQLSRRLSVEGSKLKLEVGHIEAVRVWGDEESLRRGMLILLDNALKYTSTGDGAGSGRVIVSLERLDKEAILRVKDDGIGIDAADLPHIFERFYRADRARSRQGTGLGLSIAQTLVEGLGGRITAESTPGQGSTFSIWLPLA